MATKLNQIIAIEKGVKAKAAAVLTEVYQSLGKKDQFQGLEKTYQPKDDENGEKLPPQSKKVQTSVDALIKSVMPPLSRMMDVVSTKENANAKAKADLVVNGVTLLSDVPVTYLLFLEKQLVDLKTLVSKLPTLAPDKNWDTDQTTGLWKTPVVETHRTKKVEEHFVVVQATDKFPAQTAHVAKDVIDGYWSTVDLSGEASPVMVKRLLEKIEDLQRAVQFAREAANSVEVTDKPVGDKLLEFIFG